MAEPCDICEYERDECGECEGSGESYYRDCLSCGGAGEVVPFHCCACGGMPYCHCKDTGTGPITVQLHDGTAKVIE
jgi:hypothetical protein